jgi:hypothetical protein
MPQLLAGDASAGIEDERHVERYFGEAHVFDLLHDTVVAHFEIVLGQARDWPAVADDEDVEPNQIDLCAKGGLRRGGADEDRRQQERQGGT